MAWEVGKNSKREAGQVSGGQIMQGSPALSVIYGMF